MTLEKMEQYGARHYSLFLDCVFPEWRNKSGMVNTPERVAKFMVNFTSKVPPKFVVFEENCDQMIVQHQIPVASICEHHCLPFFGTASVGYLPNSKVILGLSKLARLVGHFSANFTIQERITQQVGEFLMKHSELKPRGVGVVIHAWHSCMSVRGVKAIGAITRTQFLGGVFRSDPSVRSEFLSSIPSVKNLF